MFLVPCVPIISVVSLIKPALLTKLAVTRNPVPLCDNWPFCCNHSLSSPCLGPGMDIIGFIWAWGGRGTWRLPVLDHKQWRSSQGHISSAQTHCSASLPLTRRGASTGLFAQNTTSQSHWCVCIPLRGELSSSFVNRKGHQINSLIPWLGKSHCIILPKQWLEQIRIHNNCNFSGSSGGGPVWELSCWTQEE